MKSNICFFPVTITKIDQDDFKVTFSDFKEEVTNCKSIDDAYSMAKDALTSVLTDLCKNKQPIPEATKLESVKKEDNQTIALVKIDLNKITEKN